MKGKKIRVILITFLILFCVFSFSYVQAEGLSMDSIWQQGQSFIEQGKSKETISTDSLKTNLIPIAQILVGIATVVLVIVTLIMGIKYMVSKPDDKAKLKQQLVGLVIATAVVFGAQFIWALMYNFMKDLF